MIPVGYMAKRVSKRPDWVKAPKIVDIYSVSGCISENFADYIKYWKHNGYWFFDSPDIIQKIAKENSHQLERTSLFYYEAYELELDSESWQRYIPEPSFPINVTPPHRKELKGFDVVTFFTRNSPGCSPLSCNSLAQSLPTNEHCLLPSFEAAEANLKSGAFKNSEPGPYRIYSVYCVDWPRSI
jgi:hypothetical protein